jgi:hypothetical protein
MFGNSYHNTYRLYQLIATLRHMKPCIIGTYIMFELSYLPATVSPRSWRK